ncbi:MAG: PilZ domain-containing protein [Clostridiales bacterium]
MSNYVYDRRRFNRSNQISCKVKVANNLDDLFSVKMVNISAGGLSFGLVGSPKYQVDDKLYLELFVHFHMAEISLIVEGIVIRHSNNIYAIKFLNLESHVQNELDRIINLSIEHGIKEMILFEPSKTFFRDEL